jgi:pimeloyl-ACP methyl ester carboxylesterase
MRGSRVVSGTHGFGSRAALASLALLVLSLSLAASPLISAAAQVPPPSQERAEARKLRPCRSIERARCGSINVLLDREDPSVGKIKIGFELYPRRDRSRPLLGTIVAVEGGPGYSSTDSRSWFLDLYKPLLRRYQLLIVDNRGTGRSGAILCQPLQSYKGNYNNAVGKCGRQLGDTSDLYGSGNAADDLAEVLDSLNIDRIHLYGDSYGTFFSQTFAVRHPERLHSVVLDAAYFVAGTDPFYVDTNRAIDDAFRFSCERSPACAARPGSTMKRVARLTEQLRDEPIVGRAQDADGEVRRVRVGVGGMIYLVTAAATSPTLYRELDAAIRAALRSRPYVRPLLRLARETYYVGGAGPVRGYSEGLYVAVACNDYPQAYDMTSPIGERPQQYQATLDELAATQPEIFAPFTIGEWVTAPVEYFSSCLKWPVPSRVDPPVPPGAEFPDTPVLVLAGDLDSLTSPEGARQTADAFPNSTYVEVANMVHVSALSDFDRCASLIVRRFVRTLDAGDTSCAQEYNEIRLVDRFVRSAERLDWGSPKKTTARVAAATLGDVIARWLSMGTFSGTGLGGGSFTTSGSRLVRWRLNNVRWVRDVKVSGTASWDRRNGRVRASLTVKGGDDHPGGKLRLRWNDWRQHAQATAVGRLGGTNVRFSFPAP